MQSPLNVFGFLYTRRCTARCAHCGSESGPEVRGRLDNDVVERCLDAVARSGLVDSVIFTGGEPLTYRGPLLDVMRTARDKGLGTHLCSNGFWARDAARADQLMAELVEAGLAHLLLSTDRYHVAFVPVDAVVNAARAAARHGVSCQIAVPAAERDWEALALVANLQARTEATVFTHPVHPVGRGADLPDAVLPVGRIAGPCGLVGNLEVDVDGGVSCCPTGTEFGARSLLHLGNVHDEPLDDILDRYLATPFYGLLAAEGPLAVAEMLVAAGVAVGPAIGMRHICGLCRTVVHTRRHVERFVELTGIPLLEPASPERYGEIVASARSWRSHAPEGVATC